MKKSEQGVITLEACISVLSFMILMLILSSLFLMFMAQNVTAHAILQTSESLSLDAYKTDSLVLEDGKIGEVGDYIANFVNSLFGGADDNPYFVTEDKWYASTDESQVDNAVRTRFIGYLSGGNEAEADEFLKSMNVVDGLNGLDFSESYVANDTLYVVLKYKLEYDFNMWNLGVIDVEQKACSKLWRKK